MASAAEVESPAHDVSAAMAAATRNESPPGALRERERLDLRHGMQCHSGALGLLGPKVHTGRRTSGMCN